MQNSTHTRRQWWRYAAFVVVLVAFGVTVAALAASGTLKRWFGHERQAKASTGQLWTCGMHPQVIQDQPGKCPICHMELTPLKATASAANSGGERKVKYWWDPMLGPSSISDKPGKSAMGMDLVPVYEDQASGGPEVVIDPVVVQNMGVRTAKVTQGPLRSTVRAVGLLKEVEPNVHDVNLRLSGWVEKLYAHTEGMHVNKGDPLFDLYSPQLQVAVEELIAARRASASMPGSADELSSKSTAAMVESAERKLLLLGIQKEEVARLAKLERAPRTVAFTSPVTGHVTERSVVQGAAVKEGERVLRIVDHSTLWLDAQIYESQLPFIRTSQKATSTVASLPGKQFEGEVIFVHPHVDLTTRTVMVRLVIPNEEMVLRPGMYATVLITAEVADEVVLAPREAVIDTGTRQVAFLARAEGHFEPRSVKMGVMAPDGMVQVLEGLSPGETVVTSGQFLIDAESRMKEAIQKHLTRNNGQSEPSAEQTAQASPSETRPSTAPGSTAETRPKDVGIVTGHVNTDALVKAYLDLSGFFGRPQKDDQPADVQALITAAEKFGGELPAEKKALAEKIAKAGSAMKDQPVDRQRGLLKPVSEAVIALVDQVPPSKTVADKLFVMHCPMADDNRGANWLQTTETLANPYFAKSMKRCGEMKRTIDLQGTR